MGMSAGGTREDYIAWRRDVIARADRAVPLRAKQLATVMMAISSTGAAIVLPAKFGWIPGACCLAVAIWLWRLPTRAPTPQSTPSG